MKKLAEVNTTQRKIEKEKESEKKGNEKSHFLIQKRFESERNV